MASGSYFGNETCRIVELGSFDPGDTVTVRLSLCESEMYIRNADTYFYYLDSDTFAEVMPELDLCGYRMNEDWNDDHFTGTINIEDGRELVFTSIPYDKGWKIKCNGKIIKADANQTFITLKVKKGNNLIEMNYVSPGFYEGIILTVIGILLFAIWQRVEKRKH